MPCCRSWRRPGPQTWYGQVRRGLTGPEAGARGPGSGFWLACLPAALPHMHACRACGRMAYATATPAGGPPAHCAHCHWHWWRAGDVRRPAERPHRVRGGRRVRAGHARPPADQGRGPQGAYCCTVFLRYCGTAHQTGGHGERGAPFAHAAYTPPGRTLRCWAGRSSTPRALHHLLCAPAPYGRQALPVWTGGTKTKFKFAAPCPGRCPPATTWLAACMATCATCRAPSTPTGRPCLRGTWRPSGCSTWVPRRDKEEAALHRPAPLRLLAHPCPCRPKAHETARCYAVQLPCLLPPCRVLPLPRTGAVATGAVATGAVACIASMRGGWVAGRLACLPPDSHGPLHTTPRHTTPRPRLSLMQVAVVPEGGAEPRALLGLLRLVHWLALAGPTPSPGAAGTASGPPPQAMHDGSDRPAAGRPVQPAGGSSSSSNSGCRSGSRGVRWVTGQPDGLPSPTTTSYHLVLDCGTGATAVGEPAVHTSMPCQCRVGRCGSAPSEANRHTDGPARAMSLTPYPAPVGRHLHALPGTRGIPPSAVRVM